MITIRGTGITLATEPTTPSLMPPSIPAGRGMDPHGRPLLLPVPHLEVVDHHSLHCRALHAARLLSSQGKVGFITAVRFEDVDAGYLREGRMMR